MRRWENLTETEKQKILDQFYRKKMEDETRAWEEEQAGESIKKLEDVENKAPMKEITQEWIEEKMKNDK